MKDWLKKLFEAIDQKNVDGFMSFLTDDACFKFSNMPSVSGRENIRSTISNFFSSLKGMRHTVSGVWEHGNVVICEGKVTYTHHNNHKLTFPFMNKFCMKDGLIVDYSIYVDASSFYAESG